MKINNISKQDDIFTISFTPSWFEKLCRIKPISKRYKHYGQYYINGEDSYINEKGEILSPFDTIVKYINNFKLKF